MSTVRIKRRHNPFAQIDLAVLEDDSISWKAKGVISYLLSKPDGWKVRISDIVKHGPKTQNGQAKKGNGEDAIYEALKELRLCGYADLIIKREKGVIVDKSWIVFEERQKPKPDYPCRDNPDMDNPDQDNTPISNNEFRYNDSFSNNEFISAEINSATDHKKTKEKKEGWTKEVAILFDQIREEKGMIKYNWIARSNWACLEDLRRALRQDISAKFPDFTWKMEKEGFEYLFRYGYEYLKKIADSRGGPVEMKPRTILNNYNSILEYARSKHKSVTDTATKPNSRREQMERELAKISRWNDDYPA